MKKLILLFSLLVIASRADEYLYAIVQGTNVVGVWQFDPARPPNLSGRTNVLLSPKAAEVVQRGWRYVGGVFLRPDGSAIPPNIQTRIDRSTRIDLWLSQIADMQTQARTALTNWATLTAGQKDTAQRRTIQGVLDLSELLEVYLRQQRNQVEVQIE